MGLSCKGSSAAICGGVAYRKPVLRENRDHTKKTLKSSREMLGLLEGGKNDKKTSAPAQGTCEVGDAVSIYLKDVANTRLLTAQEEIKLGKSIALGLEAARCLEDEDTSAALKPEERAALQRAAEKGNAAKCRLVEANLRLVCSVAKKYTNTGLPMGDLIQEGNLGLMKAAEKYDYKKGNRFSTYATWWIRQSIMVALSNEVRIIRVPVYVSKRIHKLNGVINRLQEEYGHEPSIEEIARDMELPADKVEELMRYKQVPDSLERPVGEEDGRMLGDLLVDEDWRRPEAIIEEYELAQEIRKHFEMLSEREQLVLHRRYGFDDGRIWTLEQVGTQIGLSRERVRQIEKEALRKLRYMVAGA